MVQKEMADMGVNVARWRTVVKILAAVVSLICALVTWVYCVLIASEVPVHVLHKVAVALPTLVLILLAGLVGRGSDTAGTCGRWEEHSRGLAYALCRLMEVACFMGSFFLLLTLNDYGLTFSQTIPSIPTAVPYWHSLLGGVLLVVEYLLMGASFALSYTNRRLWGRWMWGKSRS
ncbi:MAG: hypothetical protein MSC53_04250 [Arcanobacterium sp.]|nr:hypothetical protein [Arcanobacterium sp.]